MPGGAGEPAFWDPGGAEAKSHLQVGAASRIFSGCLKSFPGLRVLTCSFNKLISIFPRPCADPRGHENRQRGPWETLNPEGESLEGQGLGGGGEGDFPREHLSTPSEPTRLLYFSSGDSCPSSSQPCSHLGRGK